MKNPQKQYQEQEILNASPTELITKLYDFAIQACYQKDEQKLKDVLATLTDSLNMDFEISGDLHGLYTYCREQAMKGSFKEVREILVPIRGAWVNEVQEAEQETSNISGEGFVV